MTDSVQDDEKKLRVDADGGVWYKSPSKPYRLGCHNRRVFFDKNQPINPDLGDTWIPGGMAINLYTGVDCPEAFIFRNNQWEVIYPGDVQGEDPESQEVWSGYEWLCYKPVRDLECMSVQSQIFVRDVLNELLAQNTSDFLLPPLQYKNISPTDIVNNPSHYMGDNGIECIDAIRGSMSLTEFQGHCKGTIEAYLWRYNKKGTPKTDLKKAEYYLKTLIDTLPED